MDAYCFYLNTSSTRRQKKRCLIPSSSRAEVFCEKGVLKSFTMFSKKHTCVEVSFNKVSDLKASNFIKKILQHKCFPVNIRKFLRTTFSMENLWWLLWFQPYCPELKICFAKIIWPCRNNVGSIYGKMCLYSFPKDCICYGTLLYFIRL